MFAQEVAINFWEVLHGSRALKQIKGMNLHIEMQNVFFHRGTLETNILQGKSIDFVFGIS